MWLKMIMFNYFRYVIKNNNVLTFLDPNLTKWVCDECQNDFLQEISFWEHLAIHRGIFACKTCNKNFPNLGAVNISKLTLKVQIQ